MLLIFKITNTFINNIIYLSKELSNIVRDINEYSLIVFFQNINASILVEVKNNKIYMNLAKKDDLKKVKLIIKLTTRDFVNLIFDNKKNLNLNIVGQADIAEIFLKIFKYIKLNWYKIILKKVNNSYINILLRLIEITKNRMFFNKYFLKKIVYEYLLDNKIIVSSYHMGAFIKTVKGIKKKIAMYDDKMKKMEK